MEAREDEDIEIPPPGLTLIEQAIFILRVKSRY